MGVHGLWKLIEPSSRTVPLETMANKVLAIDVSIWLHQAIKGMHDTKGSPLACAHLLLLFHRLCKLLYFKIKPIFVFDGGVPVLKRQTMAARRVQKNAAKSEAVKVREKMLKNLLRHEAVRQLLADQAASSVLGLNSLHLPGPSEDEALFMLPEVDGHEEDSEDSHSSEEDECGDKHYTDIHAIDVTGKEFKSLPAQQRHEILSELIETRKQNSWRHIDLMPKESSGFSDFQMKRLLQRHAVQTSLSETEKEIGGRTMSLQEFEVLLKEQGVLNTNVAGERRIAQDNETRFFYVQKNAVGSDVKKCDSDVADILRDLEEPGPSSSIKQENVVEDVAELAADDFLDSDHDDELTQQQIYNIIQSSERLDSTQDKASLQESKSHHSEAEAVHVDLDEDSSEGESNEISQTSSELLKEEGKNVKEAIQVVDISSSVVSSQKADVVTEQKTDSAVTEVDDSSDSESEFLEIKHDQTQLVDEEIEEKDKPIQVIVDPDTNAGDDLFADVFETKENEPNEEPETIVEEIVTEETELEKIKLILEGDTPGPSVPVPPTPQPSLSTKDLNDIQVEIIGQHNELISEQGKQERMAQSMTDQMYLEAQELLRLFGVPFVTAPMEAEAQCAFLELIGLTQGTVTDDSDIWLFGGKTVYKNFFNQKKHVLEYRCDDIQRYFKLTRYDLIKLAMLVGSDYTPGLTGVGPVTALEILAAFPSQPNPEKMLACLNDFKIWFDSESLLGLYKKTLKTKLKNTSISAGFPDRAVIDAYLRPEVDESRESFSWAKPNVNLLQDFTKRKFGWSTTKTNELLMPVMKKLLENSAQTSILNFIKTTSSAEPEEGVLSKRVQQAVKRLGCSGGEDNDEEDNTEVKPMSKKIKPQPKKVKKDTLPTASRSTIPQAKSSKFDEAHEAAVKRRLHENVKIPQREVTKNLLQHRKQAAAEIFKSYSKTGNKTKRKILIPLKETKLSESSSEDD